jgi:hypothetical protein
VSELSESIHLRTENPREAVELLRRAKVAGYVFPPRNGWVSVVHSRGAKPGDDEGRFRLEEANKGLLLFYDYAAEHGCWVTVHNGKKPVARIKATFDQPRPLFDRAAFERLGLMSSLGGAAVEQWVKRAHVWHERSRTPYMVAERLGLPRHQWFSYASEMTTERKDPERIEVHADGRVNAPPKKPAPHVAVAPPKKATKKDAAKKKGAAKPAKKRASAPKKAAKKAKKAKK